LIDGDGAGPPAGSSIRMPEPSPFTAATGAPTPLTTVDQSDGGDVRSPCDLFAEWIASPRPRPSMDTANNPADPYQRS